MGIETGWVANRHEEILGVDENIWYLSYAKVDTVYKLSKWLLLNMCSLFFFFLLSF